MASASGQNFLRLLFGGPTGQGGLQGGVDNFFQQKQRGQDLALNLHQMKARQAADQQKFNLSETTAERRHQEQLARIDIAGRNATTNEFRATSRDELARLGLNQDDEHFRSNLSFQGQKLLHEREKTEASQGLDERKQGFSEKMGMRTLVQKQGKINADITHDEGMLKVAQQNAETSRVRAESLTALNQAKAKTAATGDPTDEIRALQNLLNFSKSDPSANQDVSDDRFQSVWSKRHDADEWESYVDAEEDIRWRRPTPQAKKDRQRWKDKLETFSGTLQPSQGPVQDSTDVQDALNLIDNL